MSERTPTEVAQAERQALLDDYWQTFTSAHGARVLEDIKRSTYVYRSMHADMGLDVDPLRLAVRAGMHSVALAILEKVDHARAGHAEIQTHAVSSTATQEP